MRQDRARLLAAKMVASMPRQLVEELAKLDKHNLNIVLNNALVGAATINKAKQEIIAMLKPEVYTMRQMCKRLWRMVDNE